MTNMRYDYLSWYVETMKKRFHNISQLLHHIHLNISKTYEDYNYIQVPWVEIRKTPTGLKENLSPALKQTILLFNIGCLHKLFLVKMLKFLTFVILQVGEKETPTTSFLTTMSFVWSFMQLETYLLRWHEFNPNSINHMIFQPESRS